MSLKKSVKIFLKTPSKLLEAVTQSLRDSVQNIYPFYPNTQILGEPKQNRKLAAEITVQNPLPEPLSNCCFSIEGANLTGGKTIKERFE